MKGTDLLILKVELGIESNAKLSRLLGVSETTFYKSLLKPKVPRPLALACSAVRYGLEPYNPGPVDPELIRLYSAGTIKWMMDQLVEDGATIGDQPCSG